MHRMTLASLLSLALLGASSNTALAQTTQPHAGPGAAPGSPPAPQPGAVPGQPPAAPPPGYGAPPGYYPPPETGYGAPPGYGPPPGYYPPPGYGAPPGYYPYPPPAAAPPPSRLPYNEGEPIPPGYTLESRARRGLLVGGVATFAATYGISFIIGLTAASSSSSKTASAYGPLLVPVAGPFITISTADTQEGTPILILDGLAQAAGVGMIIGAFAAKEKFLQRSATASAVPEVFVGPRSMAMRWQF